MFESILLTAFVMGLISASSLPMGAITAAFWRPSDRVTAMLMAFGGGALLAALTIDLVAASVEEGHFYALAFGAVVGGLLFTSLNQLVNDYGGFLRKASTTIYHLRRKQHQQIRQIISRIHQVRLFHNLPTADFKAIAPSVRIIHYRQREAIYRKGDPPDTFYIIDQGRVELFDPAAEERVETLDRYSVFGWHACLTSAPNAFNAIAAADATVWAIPKHAIDTLLLNSPQFQQEVHLLLRSGELTGYLQKHHGLSGQAAEDWSDQAAHELIQRGVLPAAVEVERMSQQVMERFPQLKRLPPLFRDLPFEELQMLAHSLIHKRYDQGETFFHQNTRSDRAFIIASGAVNLIDPITTLRKTVSLSENDTFGFYSMLTGGGHSATAMATRETWVWELRRSDFLDLLKSEPVFAQRYRAFLQQGEAVRYLESRHLNSEQAARWSRSALRSLDSGAALPLAADVALEMRSNHAAPLAIWLGITLDGIPESLVIGASLINSNISLSLIAGLFLSNYPEALSSSSGMREQGFGFRRILVMWTSLMLFTGIGAALGNIFFVNATPAIFALVEGVAAGAMLTMIAETMMPEAYFKGGSVVGMSTLAGFLVAIFFKTLETV
ncbi:MAG: cyclic nucleotide-binding domain-containing protein [Candidatus Thiodiazotropha sp. 6PLUC2]